MFENQRNYMCALSQYSNLRKETRFDGDNPISASKSGIVNCERQVGPRHVTQREYSARGVPVDRFVLCVVLLVLGNPTHISDSWIALCDYNAP